MTMHDFERIRAAIIRGGTSKGVYLLANELPGDPAARDRVILSIFGSPDQRQIDGLGGADPLTSKVAIISRSSRADADIDYTIGYVGIAEGVVDYEGNCGNILQGVGPYAVDEGLVVVTEPITRVRIFNTNTRKIIEAEVPVSGGKARTEGDYSIQGVPGTGAKIFMNFVDSGGSKTGRLLPTGNVIDCIQLADGRRVRASLVDAANPSVFVQASEIGLTGAELPAEAAANPKIIAVMQELRAQAAVMMGLAPSIDKVSPAVPKVGVVAPPRDYQTITGKTVAASEVDFLARTLALGVMHKAYAVTGGICVSAASRIEGTVVHEIARPSLAVAGRSLEAAGRALKEGAKQNGTVRVGHPSGVSQFGITVERKSSGEFELVRSGVAGTARRIMDGHVYVPRRVTEPGIA
jgi:hypothetical protein